MSKCLHVCLVIAVVTGCSKGPSDDPSGAASAREQGAEGSTREISGPFPKTIRGTIAYSYPVDEDSGLIKLNLLEHGNAVILVSTATYDAKGMEEDDAEISLTIEPVSSEYCGDESQCFRGY